jgi:hypothetical protein
MPSMTPEQLAELQEQDQKLGRTIARTLAAAEAQTLDILPREERAEHAWIRIAMMMDGYNISHELLGRDARAWFGEIYETQGERPPLEFLRQLSVMELRLLLFAYYRADYWNNGGSTSEEEANDILDVLREKLEEQK